MFISHATTDKWLARVLCEKIEARGAKTFRDDRDIDGGDDIPDTIRIAIEESREMIVLMTPLSVNRPWINWEIGAAWLREDHIRIIVVLCHVDVSTMPAMIQRRKVINLNEFDEYLNELADRVKEDRR